MTIAPFDLVNMEVALHTHAPVLLVTDIDRGGSLAALVGPLALLPEVERTRVKGFIFNKFRGDQRLFDPAIRFLQDRTACPTLGVIPYMPTLSLMEEDALRQQTNFNGEPEIDIAVVADRRLSNFTDFNPLMCEPGVMIRFVRTPAQMGQPDAVILPGTKNTTEDLFTLFTTGLAKRILTLAKEGIPIIGICGGYQMMGKSLIDQNKIESNRGDMAGLGLLDVETEFRPEKITRQVSLRPTGTSPFFPDPEEVVCGYEIHSGVTRLVGTTGHPAFRNLPEDEVMEEGFVDQSALLFGTTLHGFFENDLFRRRFVNILRKRKHLPDLSSPVLKFHQMEDQQIEDWSIFVANHLDLNALKTIMESSK